MANVILTNQVVYFYKGVLMLIYFRVGLVMLLSSMIVSCGSSNKYKEPATNIATSEVNIYRPSSPLTLTQGVKVAVDDEFVDKIWHNETLRFNVSQGVSEFETSVSLSLGLPNITGFNGARDYEQSFNLKQPKHFFKITFKPSLLGGQHVITEIDAKEFKEISKN